MRLLAVRLRNWKAFASLELDFEGASGPANLAIIEGSNGFGKTSLLEALLLCLYGREGIGLVGRAGSAVRPDLGYDAFLERALHAQAQGTDNVASVELTFVGTADERFTIQRFWYFSASGRHRAGDEEVRIWDGPDDELVPLPAGDEQFAEVRDLVAARLLPMRLAPFFIFDGEHLDRLAGHNLDKQVRDGLEHALGIPVLRRTIDDLRIFARDRRREVKGGRSEELERLTAVVAGLEERRQFLAQQLDQHAEALTPLRIERDATVARIGSLHGESYASFKRLFEEREICGRARDALQERLRQTLSFDLALALAGTELRQAARAQLARDAEIERQETTRSISSERYEQIVSALGKPDELERAGLSSEQWTALEPRLAAIWAEVWRHEDSEVAQRIHGYLGEADRLLVDERLRTIEALGAEQIATLAHEAEAGDAAVAGIDQQIAAQRGTDDASRELADRLGDIQSLIGEHEERSRAHARELDAIQSELAAKGRALARLRGQLHADAPGLARADQADAAGRAIGRLIEHLFPANVDALGREMTRAYRAMAHKDVVEEIRIAPDGTVAMLDAAGQDLRQLDPSAGESQVFAFALMAAITNVAAPFPIILDTPLARLDPEHRVRVLRYFAGLDRQIIFLSQPAELSEVYVDFLRPQIGTVVHLTHEQGRSSQMLAPAPRARASA